MAQVARNLARLGYAVDVFTRDASQPDIFQWLPRVRVVHVSAGPAQYVRKEDLRPLINEFSNHVRDLCAAMGSTRGSNSRSHGPRRNGTCVSGSI